MKVWEKKIEKFAAREDIMEENLKKTFIIIWGQCSVPMREKFMAYQGYETRKENSDCVWILLIIRAIANRFEEERNIFLAIDDARSTLGSYRQDNRPNHEYYTEFKQLVDTCESYSGNIGNDSALLKTVMSDEDSDFMPAALSADVMNDTGTIDSDTTLAA